MEEHLSVSKYNATTHKTRSTFSNLIACILVVASLAISEAAKSATHNIINLGELTAAVLGYDDPNWGQAYDINEAGQIVGHWQDNAFFYDPVTGMNGRPIPNAANPNSYFTGLNDSGLTVGWTSDELRVIYDPGTDTYTPIAGGSPNYADIDNSGTIIERSYEEMLAGYTGPTDLLSLLPTNSGWDSLTPIAMNSSGQIVGWGRLTDPPPGNPLDSFAFLMNPIPVPAAVWLFGSGLLGLIGIARRKVA